MNPVKLFLYFGHSAAPSLYNYVAALVLYETRGSVRGLNRWEYEWLALSPKFNVKLMGQLVHRVRLDDVHAKLAMRRGVKRRNQVSIIVHQEVVEFKK